MCMLDFNITFQNTEEGEGEKEEEERRGAGEEEPEVTALIRFLLLHTLANTGLPPETSDFAHLKCEMVPGKVLICISRLLVRLRIFS